MYDNHESCYFFMRLQDMNASIPYCASKDDYLKSERCGSSYEWPRKERFKDCVGCDLYISKDDVKSVVDDYVRSVYEKRGIR